VFVDKADPDGTDVVEAREDEIEEERVELGFVLIKTMVGVMELIGRLPPKVSASPSNAVRRNFLPPAGALAYGNPETGSLGNAVKSVSSLFNRNPRPGTTTAEPMFSSIVVVIDTMFLH